MNRRGFLTGTGIALAVTLSGCLGDGGDDNESPNQTTNGDTKNGGAESDGEPTESDSEPDTPVLSGYEVSEQPVTADLNDWGFDPGGVFVGSREVAQDHFGDTDAEGFVAETDFDGGERILYVRAVARQTCYELRVNGEPQVTGGVLSVSVGITRTAPADEPCGDAMTPVATLVRFSFDPAGPPADVVTVAMAGESGALRLEVDT